MDPVAIIDDGSNGNTYGAILRPLFYMKWVRTWSTTIPLPVIIRWRKVLPPPPHPCRLQH